MLIFVMFNILHSTLMVKLDVDVDMYVYLQFHLLLLFQSLAH